MSSSLIAILISVAIALVMLISFFIGMRRGVKKSLLNLGISAIMLITAFLLTPVITNALMGISVTYNGRATTLGTITSAILSGYGNIDKFIDNSPTIESFVNGIGPAICGVVVFIILCFIFKLIGQIVYVIVKHFMFNTPEEAEKINAPKARLGGGILSAAKTFLFFVCVLLPFTSLTCLLEQNFFPNYAEDSASASITDSIDSLPTPEQISNYLPKEVKRAVAGYNRSAVGYVGQLFGIHNVAFDYISQMNLNGEKISIRQTAANLLETYNYALDLYDGYKENNEDFFKKLDYNKFDNLKRKLFESGMFKGFILNTIYDYSQKYDVVLAGTSILDNYGDILEDIKTGLANSERPIDDLKNDFYKLADIIKSAGQTGFLDEVIEVVDGGDTNEFVYTVADKYIDTFVVDAVDAVFNVNIVRSSFGTLMDMLKDQLGNGDIEEILKTSTSNISNWNQFIYDVKDILTDVAELYDHINQALADTNFTVENFMEDKYIFLKANPAKVKLAVKDIGGILDKVNSLEIMKDSTNQKLIPQILGVFGFEDILDGIVAEPDQTVNYSYMCKKLANAVSYLIEFDLYDEVKNEEYTDAICKIADQISVDSAKKEKLEIIFNSLYDVPKVKEMTVDVFADSLSAFVDISVLDDANVNVRKNEIGYMTDILVALAKNKIAVGLEQVSYLEYLLTDENDFEGLISSIDENAVDELLRPIFDSQMTDTICRTIFDSIQGTMRNVTGNDGLILPYTKAKLIDENEEIRKIFKKFLAIYGVANFNAVEYEDLGAILDAMKENAYRVELLGKSNEGIFESTFNAIIAKAEREFGTDSEHPMSFVNAMNVDYIYEVEFAKLMTVVEKMQDYSTLQFVGDIKDMLSNGSDVSSSDIETMLGHISENETQVDEILQAIKDNNITIDVGEINIGGETDIEAAIETYEGISNATKELLKAILIQNSLEG